MGSIFESAMLVCFGFSWPMNVIKALKAKSAKGTSLAFILLIITGYLAGITAKFVNHQINYVVAVYFLNLVIVFVNLLVYFRNKNLDKRSQAMSVNNEKSDAVVLLGGSMDIGIPVGEISQDYEFNFKMYNRSFSVLSVKEAKELYLEHIEVMNPEAVILHIGAEDMSMFNRNSADFDIKYMDLINTIKAGNKERRIALVSNIDASNPGYYDEMNRHIKAIASSEQCTYIDINNAKLWNPEATKDLMAFMYSVGFDQPLNVKKPILDIVEIIYSYAYKYGIIEHLESQAV